MTVKYTPTPRRKEKPKTCAFRLYKSDRLMARQIARFNKISISEAVRGAIRDQHSNLFTEEKK